MSNFMHKKSLNIMKISVLLLFLGIFSVSAKSYGQETNVTFNLSNVTVNEVFECDSRPNGLFLLV